MKNKVILIILAGFIDELSVWVGAEEQKNWEDVKRNSMYEAFLPVNWKSFLKIRLLIKQIFFDSNEHSNLSLSEKAKEKRKKAGIKHKKIQFL